MLHSCDAGEKSVLTVYAPHYSYELKDGKKEEFYNTVLFAMRWFGIMLDKCPCQGGCAILRNKEWFTKPFETGGFSGNFVFSYGHFLVNAGYDKQFSNVFQWEEPYQTYLAWKAGYQMYAPHENWVYHLWDRSYRPAYASDKKS